MSLNYEMLNMLSKTATRQLHLWDIEHAFWLQGQMQAKALQELPETPGRPSVKAAASIGDDLPESFIPPVVAILPRLAANDEALAEVCRQSGRTIEKIFEERLAIIFRMLGYETQLLGQGHGRVPDGVAICQEYRYAIIYDAKVRQGAYTMGTDERAIREYIANQGERLAQTRNAQLVFYGDFECIYRKSR